MPTKKREGEGGGDGERGRGEEGGGGGEKVKKNQKEKRKERKQDYNPIKAGTVQYLGRGAVATLRYKASGDWSTNS